MIDIIHNILLNYGIDVSLNKYFDFAKEEIKNTGEEYVGEFVDEHVREIVEHLVDLEIIDHSTACSIADIVLPTIELGIKIIIG